MKNNVAINLGIKKKNETIEFSYNDIEMYNNIFSELKNKKIIKNNFFSDTVWTLDKKKSITGYINRLECNLKKTVNEYELIIKSLLLSKLYIDMDGPEPGTLVTRYKYLIDIINITDGFKMKNIEKFEDYCEEISNKPTVVDRSLAGLYDLDIFYEIEFIDEFIEVLEQKADPDIYTRARRLPKYKSVLLFDRRLNEIFDDLGYEDKKVFYPLYLWWNITMIIPLRPSEFLTIKYDCCWKDSSDRYWVTVPRSKVNDRKSKIKLVYDLEINKKTYDMINDYKNFISKEFTTNEYLISYEVRKSCFSAMNKAGSQRTRVDKEKLNPDDGNAIIRAFYERFLKDELESGIIEHIRMGDTRHYAFCNMLMQGLNPLTIAQIGGHTRLESQMHYYQQLEECTNAYVSDLAYRVNLRNHKIYDSINDYNNIEYRSRTMLALYSKEEIKNFLEIDCGWCIKYKKELDQIEFDTCGDECYDCENHIMDFRKYPFMKEKIINKVAAVDTIIKEQLELMSKLSEDIRSTVKEDKVDNILNKKLKSLGAQLKNNLKRKAILESSLLEFIIKEENNGTR